MKFGSIALDDARGAVLAHGLRARGLSLKKGRVLSDEDVVALREVGFDAVVAAVLEDGDVPEDEAATRIADALCGPGLSAAAAFTGRVNLVADRDGLLRVDAARIDEINAIDESITVATLTPYQAVVGGQIVATIKVIPFAVADCLIDACMAAAGDTPVIVCAAFRPQRAALIQTELPGTKSSVLDKTVDVMAGRLAKLGIRLDSEDRVGHAEAALAERIARAERSGVDMILIAGASAIVDRRDVVPAAIERAGGAIEHFGMPVDPGNLLLIGTLAGRAVIGLPGCARSPAYNGLDKVLERLAADLPVGGADIMTMGAGGLLKEFAGRPQPRQGKPKRASGRRPGVAAVVLAAGQSRRMGRRNKLLAPVAGRAMINHVVDALIGSRAEPVIVVTGHEATEIADALAGCEVRLVHNPDYADGLSTSLRAGIAAVPADCDGALICLGDMPRVSERVIDALLAAFDPLEGRAICVPTHRGKRGNPVLWARRFFPEMSGLSGDVGARHLIGANEELVAEVAIADDAPLIDVDTPAALKAIEA